MIADRFNKRYIFILRLSSQILYLLLGVQIRPVITFSVPPFLMANSVCEPHITER